MAAPILDVISPTILLSVGIVLIAIEALTFNFVLLWFGIAAIIVAGISLVYDFSDGAWQLASVGIIALILLVALRAKALQLFLKAKDEEVKDDFLNEPGIGIVKDGKVYYKATFWDYDYIDDLKEGEKVKVIEAKQNKVKIERIPKK